MSFYESDPNMIVAKCHFTNEDIEAAFDEEVHMFLHCHVRGYDRTGEGLSMDASFFDKYGAPIKKEESWMEGYHLIELELAKHFNECKNHINDIPKVAMFAGVAHIYRPVGHDNEPWNFTGWVPRKMIWCKNKRFHFNRHFLSFRGNELQNNMWDYHPMMEQNPDHNDIYEQIIPTDKFQGGYWLYKQPWGRYIHIMAIKSHEKIQGINYRYNYIVDPLAYRSSINDLPDNSVDGVQWSCLNIQDDGHFGDGTRWGDNVNGLEVFNDFTYFYSWHAHHNIRCRNGELMHNSEQDKEAGKMKYVYWYNTYPLEFGEFLLETCLERGVYLQVLAGNGAFYRRDIMLPHGHEMDEEKLKLAADGEKNLLADPKGYLLKRQPAVPIQRIGDFSKRFQDLEEKSKYYGDCKESLKFHSTRPYNVNTVFGHTTLIDTMTVLKNMYRGARPDSDNFEKAELQAIQWLNAGKFFSHTGVYQLFRYIHKEKQSIPITIEGQVDKLNMCYQMEKNMELKFTFPQIYGKHDEKPLVWRYTLQHTKQDNPEIVTTVQGYFNMNINFPTVLDLSDAYDKYTVKWIQFSVFRQGNPQRRAWFNPTRGLEFGTRRPNEDLSEGRIHKIAILKERMVKKQGVEMCVFTEEKEVFEPFSCKPANNKQTTLEFFFPKCTADQEMFVYVYHMQVMPHQPTLTEGNQNTQRKIDGSMSLPPRILQNISGYFKLNQMHPTKLNLGYEWDASTVKDNIVHFYCIDPATRQPRAIDPEIIPIADMPLGCESDDTAGDQEVLR